MTTEQLKESIKKMKAGLESGSIPDNVRPTVQAAIQKAEAQVAEREKEGADPKPSAQPEKRKPGRKSVADSKITLSPEGDTIFINTNHPLFEFDSYELREVSGENYWTLADISTEPGIIGLRRKNSKLPDLGAYFGSPQEALDAVKAYVLAYKSKPGRKPVAKRPKAAAAPLDSPPADKNGHEIKIGDMVDVAFKKGTVQATVVALQQRKGGGHLVEFQEGGKTVKRMAPPSIVTFVSRPTGITTERKMPKEVIKSARKVKRVDCDDPDTNILVTPKETVVLSAPQVADPADGDKILAHPDGTPIAVIEGSEVKKHFKGKGKVGVEKNAHGNAKFDLTPDSDPPEQAVKMKDDDDKREYKKVKAEKPPKGCTVTRDAAKSPKLMLVLEGMRQRWHSGESLDKIVGVFFRKSDNKVLVKVDKYNAMDWNVGYKWYTLCPETGNMTKTTAPGAGEASQLMSADAMKEFYRHPHSASCQRISKALYVECYRNGACDTDKKKRLYAVFASKCAKQELAHSKEYMKWLHKRAAEIWKGPGSGQSYASVFQSVAAAARAGK